MLKGLLQDTSHYLEVSELWYCAKDLLNEVRPDRGLSHRVSTLHRKAIRTWSRLSDVKPLLDRYNFKRWLGSK